MTSDVQVARELAREVGQALLAARDELFETFDTQGIKDAADELAQKIVVQRLKAQRPDDSVLSEEAQDDRTRLVAKRVWIIDPLDGTREYARAGRVDWAVHVALWDQPAQGFIAAAVDLPAQGLAFDTSGSPAQLPPRQRLAQDGRIRIAASQSRTPQILEQVAQSMPIEIVLWGSAGAKTARVLTGEVDAYIHDSDLNEWDSAAPVAVALAYGLHVSHLDGTPLRFNQEVPITGDLVICRPEFADQLLACLQ